MFPTLGGFTWFLWGRRRQRQKQRERQIEMRGFDGYRRLIRSAPLRIFAVIPLRRQNAAAEVEMTSLLVAFNVRVRGYCNGKDEGFGA
jgi:hypothetical protein